MGTDAMTCAEAEPLLPLVADGAIDPDSDPQLFTHLACCPACQRIVASHDLIALAIARVPSPRRRAPLLLLWPYAAAACLALAVGAWLYSDAQRTAPATPAVATTSGPALAKPIVAVSAARDVIAVPRADGTTLYLVRQGEIWQPIDPANLDGGPQSAPGGGSGVQVRY